MPHDPDLDLVSGHMAYRRASLIDPTYVPNFTEIGRKNFSKVMSQFSSKFKVTWHKN